MIVVWFDRLMAWLVTPSVKATASVTEFFVCGVFMLTGVQGIVGYSFSSPFIAAGLIGPPIALLIFGVVVLVTGVAFAYAKVRGICWLHRWLLFWSFGIGLFIAIYEMIMLPMFPGLWVGSLIMAIILGLLYLRYTLIRKS